jgi:hypothetical protein
MKVKFYISKRMADKLAIGEAAFDPFDAWVTIRTTPHRCLEDDVLCEFDLGIKSKDEPFSAPNPDILDGFAWRPAR